MTPTLPMIDELSVSLVVERCSTCASWDATGPLWEGRGVCKAIERRSIAARIRSDETDVVFETMGEFGCTLWSSKNAVEKRLREGP